MLNHLPLSVPTVDGSDNVLILAVQYAGPNMLLALLRAKSIANVVDSFGRTALHALVRRADDVSTAMLGLLFQHGTFKSYKDRDDFVDIADESGNTALIDAVNHGHVADVQLLLDRNANVSVQNHKKNTALFCACYLNKALVVDMLLKFDAPVNAVNNMGETALSVAVERARSGIIVLLLAQEDIDVNLGQSPPLTHAVTRGKENIVDRLIRAKADVNKCNPMKVTPLMLACGGHNPTLVDLLLKQASLDLHAKDGNGMTALMYAAGAGSLRIIQTLLSVDSDAPRSVDKHLFDALMHACERGHDHVARYFIDAVGVDCAANRDFKNRTSLMIACAGSADATVDVLLPIFAARGLVNSTDRYGDSALMHAARADAPNIVGQLLAVNAAVNTTGMRGFTAVMLAARVGNVDMLSALMHAGGLPETANEDGMTALMVAASEGHDVVVDALMAAKVCDDKVDNNGDNAFSLAVQNSNLEVVRTLITHSTGKYKAIANAAGFTPLISATIHGSDDMFRTVLALGFAEELDHKTNNGFSALRYAACVHGNESRTQALLEAGASATDANRRGDTILHSMVRTDNLPMVTLLLKWDAECNVCNHAGDTVLTVATSKPVFKLLLKHGASMVDANIANANTFVRNLTVELRALLLSQPMPKTVFGSDLQQLQLWLSSRLRVHDDNTRKILTVNPAEPLYVTEQLGISQNGSVVADPTSLEVRFEGQNGRGTGLLRKWLSDAVAAMTNVDAGLFVWCANGDTVQPNTSSEFLMGQGHLAFFALFGRILAFALRHREPMPVQLSEALIKVLFGYPIEPKDVRSVDEDTYTRTLKYITTCPDQELADLEQPFTVPPPLAPEYDEPAFKKRKMGEEDIPLKEGGAQIAVTPENKEEYVLRYANFLLHDQFDTQIKAMQAGIHVLFSGKILKELRANVTPLELRSMICESAAEMDVDAWRAAAKYSGFDNGQHQQIEWLWNTVAAMPDAKRRKLLAFVTGSTAVPQAGYDAFMGYDDKYAAFTVQELEEANSNLLPTAQTCFNTLVMPAYTTEAVFNEKLQQALGWAQGFNEDV